MKLYANTDKQDYICTFDATITSDKYKKLFKKLKKLGTVQAAYLRLDGKSEDDIKKAIKKLEFAMPTEIEAYPDSIELIKMPYPRRAGLDKVGKFITYYQMEISICTMPTLFYLIFDENEEIREDAIRNIWHYLNSQWNDVIKEIFDKIAFKDGYLDYAISEEDKLDIVSKFLESLDITLSDVIPSPLNNTEESDDAYYLSSIVKTIKQNKDKVHKRKLK